ncbi:MAG: organomercurial lyase [Sphingobium sp.]
MSWPLSGNAKTVRRAVYEKFLSQGASQGTSELLHETGLTPDQLKAAVVELEHALMVMCVPGTHDVAKCPPWTNIPTRHRVEVDGEHGCYAGCMLEGMNIAHCYPGKVATIRTTCPQTGREIVLKLRGNEVVEANPPEMVGHVGIDPARWVDNWFHACANNNFFVSTDAVAAWETAHPEFRGVTLSLDQLSNFARYDYRLDYERGADPNNPRSGHRMFEALGAQTPGYWS